MSIGSRIKERREELKITQVELAQLVGVSKGSIGNYESGISAPNEKILYRLFTALKCDANYLYQDDMQVLLNKNEFKIESSEKAHIKKYRTLDQFGKKAVDDLLDNEYERCQQEKKTELIPTLVAARSKNNDEPIHIENLPDLSKFPEDDTDL